MKPNRGYNALYVFALRELIGREDRTHAVRGTGRPARVHPRHVRPVAGGRARSCSHRRRPARRPPSARSWTIWWPPTCILALEGVLDAMGHVSVRHPAAARSLLPGPVDGAGAGHRRRHPRVRPRQQRRDARRPARLSRALHPRRDLPGPPRRPRRGPLPHAVADSLRRPPTVPLRAMYHMAAFVAAGVPVWDIATAAGVTDLLVRDGKLAKALAGSLGDRAGRADAGSRRRGRGRLAAERRRPQRLPRRQRARPDRRPSRSAGRSAA